MRPSDSVEHVAGYLACSEREPRNEYDSIRFAVVHDIIPFTIGKAVAVLHRHDGNDLARPLNMLPGDVRQCDQANLALAPQLGKSFNRGLKRHDWIGMMQL